MVVGTEFYNGKFNDGKFNPEQEGYFEPISIVTLDSLNLPKVDFIKIDTEGYEAPILRGARETIKRCRPIISMSAYHNPNDKTELPALLNSITPYRCELHRGSEEDFICKPILD